MTLFHLIGHPNDNTYLYDFNPDPSRYEEVVPEPAPVEVEPAPQAPVDVPTPTVDPPAEPETPAVEVVVTEPGTATGEEA